MRWLAAASMALGLVFGVAFPASVFGAPTGYTIVASLTPPTLSSGSNANLNCGWHVACVNPYTNGVGLDWEDGNTGFGNPWYFRGFFASNNPAGGVVATGAPLVNQQGSDRCDIMTVWIIEKFNGVLRAAPTYTHVNMPQPQAQFGILGSPLGTYITRQIGGTIDDSLNCQFGGSHVHEGHSNVSGVVTTSRNTGLYPTGLVCHNNACGTFTNNNPTKWTRRFTWLEGG